MPKPEQPSLPISLGIRDLQKRAGSRLLAIVREVTRVAGKQEAIAKDLGISDSHLSQALKGDGKNFSVEWLPALLRYDHERKILKYLAWEANCRIEPIEPLTKEQKYDLLVAELRRSAADVEALERRAYDVQEGE
jgi:hypothetical protein